MAYFEPDHIIGTALQLKVSCFEEVKPYMGYYFVSVMVEMSIGIYGSQTRLGIIGRRQSQLTLEIKKKR